MPAPNVQKTSGEIRPLTSIRFVAAAFVVLYHTFYMFVGGVQNKFIGQSIAMGFSGVSLFFILSGFILAYVYLKDGKKIDRRGFWVARFARIYPLYCVALLVHAPFVIAYVWSRNAPLMALGKLGSGLMVNLTLLQAWIPGARGPWNGPGWTLSVEAFFYAVFPFIGPLFWRLRPPVALLSAAALFAVSVAASILVGGHFDRVARGVEWFNNPLLRLPEFALGIVAARLFHLWLPAISNRQRQFLAIGCVALGIALLAMADHFWSQLNASAKQAGLLAPAYCLIIFGLASKPAVIARALSVGFLVLLGEISYGVYLLHIPLLFWFDRFSVPGYLFSSLPPVHSGLPLHRYALFAGYLFLVLFASWLSYRCIETPARQLVRDRLGAKRKRAGARPDTGTLADSLSVGVQAKL